MDTQEIEFSRKLEKEKSLLNIMMLVPHRRYLVSIKVQSAGVTSEVVEDSTITMIDRKCSQRSAWDPLSHRGRGLRISLGHFHQSHSLAHSPHAHNPVLLLLGEEDQTLQENGDISLDKVLR